MGLIGIDAPEPNQSPGGVQSREAVKTLVGENNVRSETDLTKRDQCNRLLAYVHIEDFFVNAELIRQGQAVLYTVPPNIAHVEKYQQAQTEAREAGRGVWDAGQPLDVDPECYRKQKKGRDC